MNPGRLYHVQSPYFTAGFVVSKRGAISVRAPILHRHLNGLTEDQALAYCQQRRWRVTLVAR